MTRKSLLTMVLLTIEGLFLPVSADTFKNKETGEIFYGFRTQKRTANQTLVYNDATKKLTPVDLSGFEVKMDNQGRRNSVVMISITDGEVLLSEAVTKNISEAIIKAANTGPQFILLKIDNPGGRGEYMKQLCSTISNTDNCKIAAYIAGGPFGGAHSAAAVLALACDKIYMAPTASISSVGPFINAPDEEFVKMYSSDSLASFSVFAATLAERNQRPALLAKSLLDKKLSLVEVSDKDGRQAIVEKNSRQPTQTIIKTLCEGVPDPLEQPSGKESKPSVPPDIHNRVLNLTAEEAIRLKLADRIVNSVQDILEDMNASGALIVNAPGIDAVIKQFIAARKNIGQRLTKIEFLENRAATLEEQLNTIEKEIRTTPTTRTQTRRGRVYNKEGRYYSSDGQNMITGYGSSVADERYADNYNRIRPTQSPNQRIANTETVTTTEPATTAIQTKTELLYILNELVGEYRQTINTAKRWVGALPSDVQIQTLEKNMNSAMALAENLRVRP